MQITRPFENLRFKVRPGLDQFLLDTLPPLIVLRQQGIETFQLLRSLLKLPRVFLLNRDHSGAPPNSVQYETSHEPHTDERQAAVEEASSQHACVETQAARTNVG